MSTDILDTPEAGPAAVRGAALRVAGYLAGVILSVASAALLLRYLGAERFGRYATIFSLMAIVLGLTDAPTAVIGVREWAVRTEAARREMLRNLVGLRLAVGFAGAVCAVIFAVIAPYNDQQVIGTVLAGLGLLATVAGVTLTIPLQAELRMIPVTLLDLVRQVTTVIVLIALVIAGAGVALLLGTPIVAGLVTLVVTIALVRDRTGISVAFHRHVWRDLLGDTLPYAAATAVGVIYSYVTIIVMSLVTTDTETGYFGAGHRVFYVLAMIPGLLVSTALPVLARAERDDRARLSYALQRLLDMQLVIGAALALVVSAGAPVAIAIVAGSSYDPAIPVLRLQAAALFTTSIIALGGFALLTLKEYGPLLRSNALALVATTVLTVILAESDGATGAATAMIIGEVLLAASYLVVLFRRGLLPSFKGVPRVALAAGLAAIPGFALGLPAIPAALGTALVFVAAAFALRAVPEEALEAFISLRAGRAAPRTPPPSDPS